MNEVKIDRIVRSRRRTISLIISPDATLTVRAPLMTTLEYIKKLVFKKRSWINKKQMQILKNGGPLKTEPIPKEVIERHKKQALQTISARADFFSRVTGWKFKSIKVTKAESRWGSCGPNGSINFSWKLIMAPLNIIDYVVVHELAHITERNHSARFWDKVSAALPDYKERRKWLRENGAKLRI